MVPIQYYLVYLPWPAFSFVFIPVYCFIFLAIRSTLTGDTTRYLERTAKIQWGVLIAVYFLSHAPALLMLSKKLSGAVASFAYMFAPWANSLGGTG